MSDMDAEVIELSSSSDLSDIEYDAVEEVDSPPRPATTDPLVNLMTLPIRRRLIRRNQLHQSAPATTASTPINNNSPFPFGSVATATDTPVETIDSDNDEATNEDVYVTEDQRSDHDIHHTITEEEGDEGEEDDDLEIIEFRKKTQSLISHKYEQQAEKLNQVTCPICFESPDFPTVTSCGHLFCLECIKQSLSSSAARGQVSHGSRGAGLCPLCRKRVVFKDTVVLRLCTKGITELPPLPS